MKPSQGPNSNTTPTPTKPTTPLPKPSFKTPDKPPLLDSSLSLTPPWLALSGGPSLSNRHTDQGGTVEKVVQTVQTTDKIIKIKDGIISQKMADHREVLDACQLLKEKNLILQTELERADKNYANLKKDVREYRDKTYAQHLEIVEKLKTSEEFIKELTDYLVSVGKYSIGAYEAALRAIEQMK